jgi:hypothetical protein
VYCFFCLCGHKFSLGYVPRDGMLGPLVTMFNFLRNYQTLFPERQGPILCWRVPPMLIIDHPFILATIAGCEVVSHGYSDLQFSL